MKIKNWKKFQHFKDRRPPWIKLHREILEQRDINSISDCSFRVLVGLWLLASEDELMEGNLPSIDDISFRLRIDKTKIIKALDELKPFLIQDDIKSISEQYQDDDPEKEAETKSDKETEEDIGDKSPDRFQEFWDVFADKRSRKAANKVWNRKKLDLIADVVIEGARKYVKIRGPDRQFWKQAQGWLNDERWEDEPVDRSIAHEENRSSNESRTKRVNDKLDEIARRDIEENGFTDFLG